ERPAAEAQLGDLNRALPEPARPHPATSPPATRLPRNDHVTAQPKSPLPGWAAHRPLPAAEPAGWRELRARAGALARTTAGSGRPGERSSSQGRPPRPCAAGYEPASLSSPPPRAHGYVR